MFILTISNTLFSQKKESPPVVQNKIPYKIVYAEGARYTYTLNTKKISILKPNTPYLKVLTFESEKKATMETVYNTEEVRLIDNNLLKTVINQKVKEIAYNVIINGNNLTLIDQKSNYKIHFIAEGTYDDLILKNNKTKELFFNNNPIVKERIKTLPPSSAPKKNN
ncbi:MAG: hypothetical protein ACK5MD_09425 [Flavobacteriales bacterium]